MKNLKALIQRILANFSALNGVKFVGIKKYVSVKTGEVANFVVNANFSYSNAIAKTIAILETLTDSDFTAIEKKYNVFNMAGIKYGTNKGAKEFLATGKISKIGTKAYETTMNGVKETKLLSTIRTEMIESFIANQSDETRSAQSEAQRAIYEPVTNGVKRHIESGKLHIYAMAHSKQVITEGEYKESNQGIESAQKSAIERYCKSIGQELPTTKYRNFVIDEGQLSEVAISGDKITFV